MKAITFLGVRPQPTCYVSVDGRMIEAQHFGIALTRLYPDLDLCLLVTRKARDEQLPHFTEQIAAHAASLDVIDIPNGDNSDELWTIFEKVVAAVEEGDVVIFDITHGFRSLPFISFLVAAYLRVVKRITIEAVLYGNYDASDRNFTPPRAPIVDLTQFVSLLDWMVGADRFVRFGDARDLADLLRTQHERIKPDPRTAGKAEMAAWGNSPIKATANNLTRASRALRVVRPTDVMDASHAVHTQLPAALRSIESLARPFAPLSQQVAESFAPIALERKTQQADPLQALATERNLIAWYMERHQIFQAVALAREWLLSWVMAHVGMATQSLDKEARQRVERAIGREVQRLQDKTLAETNAEALPSLAGVPAILDVAQLYNQLGELRNDLMHAGKRTDALSAEKVESTAKTLCQKLAELPLPPSPSS